MPVREQDAEKIPSHSSGFRTPVASEVGGGEPPRNHNRIRAILLHTSRYAFEGQARLAADVGVSRSTICRLASGRSAPSYRLVQGVTLALEKALGKSLDAREIFSPDGTYPTASCCALCGCRNGCFPDEAFDAKGNLKPGWRDMQPGDWSVSPRQVSTSHGKTIHKHLVKPGARR